MIVPDINLLLYAHVAAFPDHERARQWWEALMNGTREVGIAAPALFGFVRLVSNPRVLDRPMAVDDALAVVEEWLDRPHVHFIQPGPRHLEIAFGLLRYTGAAANSRLMRSLVRSRSNDRVRCTRTIRISAAFPNFGG